MEAFKKQRTVLKSKLTSFSNFLNDLKDSIKQGEILDQSVFINIQKRLSEAEPWLHRFEQTQIELDDSEENTIKVILEYQDKYFEAVSCAESLLSSRSSRTHEVSTSTPVLNPELVVNVPSTELQNLPGVPGVNPDIGAVVNDDDRNSIISNASFSQNIRLPTIQLPKFNGHSENWLEFRDLFISLIDKNFHLDNIQKFHYLRASLEGDAAQVIKSIDFCDQNYSLAWSRLVERYNSTRVLVHNHVKSLFNLEPVVRESSHKIRKILDMVSKHLNSIKNLTSLETLGETLVIFLVTSKLDPVTLREWEQRVHSNELPSFEDLQVFMKDRADLLETLELKHNNGRPDTNKSNTKTKAFVTTNQFPCLICKGSHAIWACDKFLKYPVKERQEKVRSLKLCVLCLRKGHYIANCTSKYNCGRCRKRHNILLHEDVQQSIEEESPQVITAVASNTTQVLLPTARVKIKGLNGKVHTARVLLDSCSQSNFVTSNLVRKLKLNMEEIDITVLGISNSVSKIRFKCDVNIESFCSSFELTTSCLVVDKITAAMPGFEISSVNLKIPNDHRLADPTFNKPGEIDLLLGANHFWNLLCIGQVSLGPGLPILQKSRFGWLVSGPVPVKFINRVHCNFSQTNIDVQNQLARFWELEHISEGRSLTMEEKACEEHFVKNTRRNADGRFVVSFPLKEPITKLGNSRDQAEKRFLALERKLQRNKNLADRYIAFMDDYEAKGHMSVVVPKEEEITFYLPHHGVLKEESVTTKLRVVFDGSAATTSGYSLNNLQMVGATIQPDLLSILLRFRSGFYALSADIEKMYRMVLIEPKQRPLQRILWRSSPDQPLKDYNLNTVTYGTASGSFLAIRSLMQIGMDCEESNPEISDVIKNNFYVDDLLVSTNSLEFARHICDDLPRILTTGCFNLRKWICNKPELLSGMTETDKHPHLLDFGSHENTKTLGLLWSSSVDKLMFSISEGCHDRATKRIVLSELSQIFDPLGLLSPCTVVGKILLQSIWKEKLEWDESFPSNMHEKWSTFRKQLPLLNDLKIPRHVTCKDPQLVELHGFSDASSEAYGACIYLRSVDQNNEIHTSLLCAKSRVAPVKPTTIPRLELCGALCLARLAKQIRLNFKSEIKSCTFWCDSTIVLSWLKTSPSLLKTFVCNRIVEIQELTQHDSWRHVPTTSNPADLLSRGVTPKHLLKNDFWFRGPSWLREDCSKWPSDNNNLSVSVVPEIKSEVNCLVTENLDEFNFAKHSNLNKLERVIAYCIRFINNCKRRKQDRCIGPLSSEEINKSLIVLVKYVQTRCFRKELDQLKQRKATPSIQNLSPFLDEEGLIRVGGRLMNSEFDLDKRHPILLPSKNWLTKLLFTREHLRLLHTGPQHLLASIRERFWAISGRYVAKKVVHECIKCFRSAPKTVTPVMGDLPAYRINPSYPFQNTGVDYAGPLNLKDRKGRGCKVSKSYICLFICMVTKAVHIELVTDLSTDSFILALKRFIARRGRPSNMYSDNGTNFKGAKTELDKLKDFVLNEKDNLVEAMTGEGVNWHFIPPRSPHFGGLWEAGIRSCKFHLKRIAGNASLTFEEMYTLLVQIEAILNSRPLTPLSSDPNDLDPLTPAHFLVGRRLSTLPDPCILEVPVSRLSCFQRVQQLQQHYWARWAKEYICELQRRTKWQKPHGDLQLDALVLIKEDNLPPLMWRLGRVTQLHAGKDGIARVATIKTANGNIQRAFSKICPLPIEEKRESRCVQ